MANKRYEEDLDIYDYEKERAYHPKAFDYNKLYDYEYKRLHPKEEDSFRYRLGDAAGSIDDYRPTGYGYNDAVGGITTGLIKFAGNALNKSENKDRHRRTKESVDNYAKIAGDLALANAELKEKIERKKKEQERKIEITRGSAPLLRQYSTALHYNDTGAANKIAENLFNKLNKEGAVEGKFISHRNGDLLYEKKDGTLDKFNLEDFLASSGVKTKDLFGDSSDFILSNLSEGLGRKMRYEEELSQAELANKYPETKINQEVILERVKRNSDFLEKKILPDLNSKKKIKHAIASVLNLAENNPEITGPSFTAQARRAIANSFGLNPDIDMMKLTSNAYEQMLKGTLGAQLTEPEALRFFSTLPSLTTNVETLRAFANTHLPRYEEEIRNTENLINNYEADNTINLVSEYARTGETIDKYVNPSVKQLRPNNVPNRPLSDGDSTGDGHTIVRSATGVLKKVPDHLVAKAREQVEREKRLMNLQTQQLDVNANGTNEGY